MKKKGLTTILIIVAVVLVIYLWFKSGYNAMVEKQEAVQAQWAQVENVYQRRADLIPNLVATVKGYAQHEQGTLTAVIEARAKATSVNIDPSNITPEQLAQFQEAQDQLSGALSRLLVSIERYPELKAQRTASRWNARNSTRQQWITTSTSASSLVTLSPACLTSRKSDISRHRQVLRQLQKLNSNAEKTFLPIIGNIINRCDRFRAENSGETCPATFG